MSRKNGLPPSNPSPNSFFHWDSPILVSPTSVCPNHLSQKHKNFLRLLLCPTLSFSLHIQSVNKPEWIHLLVSLHLTWIISTISELLSSPSLKCLRYSSLNWNFNSTFFVIVVFSWASFPQFLKNHFYLAA